MTTSAVKSTTHLLATALFTASLASAEENTARPAPRPNVVLIYVDDMGRGALGCHGGDGRTPHIDRLAAEGMKFERFYITSPICTPSRYSLLTGQYAGRSPATLAETKPGEAYNLVWNSLLQPAEMTVGEALRARSYTTGMVGKWHLSAPRVPLPKEASADDPAVRESLDISYREIQGKVRELGGFDFAEGIYTSNVDSSHIRNWLPATLQHHNPEWMAQATGKFFQQQQKQERPFFLYVAPTLPHSPNFSPENVTDGRETPQGLLEARPATGMPPRSEWGTRLRGKFEGQIPNHEMAMLALDDFVGEILRQLAVHGLEKNTLVIFSSDNGWPAKGSTYDDGARLPFVVRWPGVIPAGSKNSALAANIDVAATLVDLAGGPAEPAFLRDGVSLRPLLEQSAPVVRDQVLFEVGYARGILQGNSKYTAIRIPEGENRAKLANKPADWFGRAQFYYEADKVYPHYFDSDQLFDLAADPREQNNLANRPENAERLAEMKRLLSVGLSRFERPYAEFVPAEAR